MAITHFRREGRPEGGRFAEVTPTGLRKRVRFSSGHLSSAGSACIGKGYVMFRSPISWIALCAVFASVVALAQDAAPDTVTLDPVVLAGGLSPIVADAYGRAHTVLTAEEMAQRGIRTVQDALRDVPGVAVSSAGGSFTQIRIRGAEANHTPILIDGVPATGGNDEYILSGLETANVDRIEELRGPQSVYFGSNASAGVVNVITRKGAPGMHSGGAVELGNGSAVSGWVTRRGARGGLALTVAKRDDHGFNHARNGSERDGIDRATLGLTGDWQPSEDIQLGFVLRRSKEKYRYDSTNTAAIGAGDYLIDDSTPRSERNEVLGAVWGNMPCWTGG